MCGSRCVFLLTENADNATITALVCTRQLEVLSVSSSGQLKIWDLRRPENKAARVLLMYVCVCVCVSNCHTCALTHTLPPPLYLPLPLFPISPFTNLFPSLLPPSRPLLSLLASLSPSLSSPLLPLPLVQFWRTRGATLPRPPSSPTTSGGTWSQ